MVAERITKDDLVNLANGILEVELPDYNAYNSAKATVNYTLNTWNEQIDGVKPSISYEKVKGTNTMKITCKK